MGQNGQTSAIMYSRLRYYQYYIAANDTIIFLLNEMKETKLMKSYTFRVGTLSSEE